MPPLQQGDGFFTLGETPLRFGEWVGCGFIHLADSLPDGGKLKRHFGRLDGSSLRLHLVQASKHKVPPSYCNPAHEARAGDPGSRADESARSLKGRRDDDSN